MSAAEFVVGLNGGLVTMEDRVQVRSMIPCFQWHGPEKYEIVVAEDHQLAGAL